MRLEIARAGIEYAESPESIRDTLLTQLLTKTVIPPVQVESYVVSAKHTPLDTLSRAFPTLPIIWLIRDPRDTLLSFFYHDLLNMDPMKLNWFVNDESSQQDVPTIRDDWQQRFVQARTSTLTQFYQRSIDAYDNPNNRDRILRICYEDLCKNPEAELMRVAAFLDWNCDSTEVRKVVDRFSLRTLKDKSGNDQKASFVRSGTPGEGRSKMSKAFAADFAPGFSDIVHRLGYETDPQWIESLPVDSDLRLDPSRFCPQNSMVFAFDYLWAESRKLQDRFLLPHDTDSEDNFIDWLQQQSDPKIQSFIAKSKLIQAAFGSVDVDRTGFEGLMRF